MTKSDLKCELFLKYFGTKEAYRAYRKQGGDLFGKWKTMDNYMKVLDDYELLNYCSDMKFITGILNITDRAYKTLYAKSRARGSYIMKLNQV